MNKLWDIVKKVGSAVITEAVPMGGLILEGVNALLPDDKKLPVGATGDDVLSAVSRLPPEQQAAVLSLEFEVDLAGIRESHATVRTMLEYDAKNPRTTRPYIARGAFHVVAFCVIVTISLWAYAVGTKDSEMVKSIMDGWQFLLAVLGPLVSLLWAYFGILRKERGAAMDAANGRPANSGLAGLIGSIMKR